MVVLIVMLLLVCWLVSTLYGFNTVVIVGLLQVVVLMNEASLLIRCFIQSAYKAHHST